MTGVTMSPEFNKQVVEAVKSDRRRRGVKTVDTDYGAAERKPGDRLRRKAVILDAALAAATHSLTGATSCLATVCQWSVEDEEYIKTDEQVKVWNHDETVDHAIDTFGAAVPIDGHYWFQGSCDAMADREGA